MKKFYVCPIMESYLICKKDIITDSQNDDIVGDTYWDDTINPEIFT